jgi:hypothetical protein
VPFLKSNTPWYKTSMFCLESGPEVLKSLPKILTLIKQNPSRATWWAKMEEIVPAIDKIGTGNTFRRDRPSYAKIHEYLDKQFEMFEEDSIECFCGD